jgi:hypothetical protein
MQKRLGPAVVLLASALAGVTSAREARDYAGHWVFKLGERNFMLLELTVSDAATGPVAGNLVRPKHLQVDSGGSFTGIELPTVSYPVVRSSLTEDALRLTVANPEDAKDEDQFELRLTGTDRATLGLVGFPLEPWPLERVVAQGKIATDWVASRTYRHDDSDISSPEMQRIFEADQADRKDPKKIDWSVVSKSDDARRAATKALLDGGKLHTGDDFERAAFVFQHGKGADDYLLAHTLALVAVAKGNAGALWIASATLDRYLQSIQKPQIYGTQYLTPPGGEATQEPYNRSLVSDALRRQLSVPPLAEQEKRRKQIAAEN